MKSWETYWIYKTKNDIYWTSQRLPLGNRILRRRQNKTNQTNRNWNPVDSAAGYGSTTEPKIDYIKRLKVVQRIPYSAERENTSWALTRCLQVRDRMLNMKQLTVCRNGDQLKGSPVRVSDGANLSPSSTVSKRSSKKCMKSSETRRSLCFGTF